MRVSVIIPTFQRRALLPRAVETARARIGTDDEILVVDDGSTDGSVEALPGGDPRLRVIRTDHRGPAAARNAGIREARGEFLAFLDSDDEWLPGTLDDQVATLAGEPAPGLSYAAARSVDERGAPVATRPRVSREGDVLRPLLRRNFITTSTVVVPRSVLEASGLFDETLDHSMDWDLWIRIAERRRFAYLDRPVALYRFHPGQQIRHRTRVDDCRRRILEKALERYRGERPELVRRVKRLLAYRLLRLGRLQRLDGDRAAARRSFRAAVRLAPLGLLRALRYRL